MILTFEKAMEKYDASMVRRCLSERTIQYKKDFLRPFGEWLHKIHEDCFQDMKAMTCEVIDEYFDFLSLRRFKPSTMRQNNSNFKAFFYPSSEYTGPS